MKDKLCGIGKGTSRREWERKNLETGVLGRLHILACPFSVYPRSLDGREPGYQCLGSLWGQVPTLNILVYHLHQLQSMAQDCLCAKHLSPAGLGLPVPPH